MKQKSEKKRFKNMLLLLAILIGALTMSTLVWWEKSGAWITGSTGDYTLVFSGNGKDDYCELIIDDGATAIGDMAFAGYSGLASISIPASVTSIGAWAFGGCSNLITVTNRSITPQDISNNNAFSAVDLSTVTLRVPSSAVEAYKNAEGWKNFGTIEAM